MCAILGLIGIGLVLIMPTLMTEISLFLDEVEENNPGIFGSNGALAQGVTHTHPIERMGDSL